MADIHRAEEPDNVLGSAAGQETSSRIHQPGEEFQNTRTVTVQSNVQKLANSSRQAALDSSADTSYSNVHQSGAEASGEASSQESGDGQETSYKLHQTEEVGQESNDIPKPANGGGQKRRVEEHVEKSKRQKLLLQTKNGVDSDIHRAEEADDVLQETSTRSSSYSGIRQPGQEFENIRTAHVAEASGACLLYTSPSPRDKRQSRMPSSA